MIIKGSRHTRPIKGKIWMYSLHVACMHVKIRAKGLAHVTMGLAHSL